MKTFKYHPDNLIIITSERDQYIDAIDRFTFDCAKLDLPLIPAKPDIITEYIASVDGLSYAIEGQSRQVPFDKTGSKPDRFFIYIDNIEQLMEAQRKRTEGAAA